MAAKKITIKESDQVIAEETAVAGKLAPAPDKKSEPVNLADDSVVLKPSRRAKPDKKTTAKKTKRPLKPKGRKKAALPSLEGEAVAVNVKGKSALAKPSAADDIKVTIKEESNFNLSQAPAKPLPTDIAGVEDAPAPVRPAPALAAPEEHKEIAAPGIIRRVGLYRRLVIIFVTLAAMMLLVVGYFALARVNIVLIPNQERISNNLLFTVIDAERESPAAGAAVAGIVREASVNVSERYQSTGSEIIGEETVGEVAVVNNYTKSQILVATTRLLAPDGKLYRLKKTITVAPGETVMAEVYADEPGPEMAIGPATFMIPGLWAGLQDKIYAESREAFVYAQTQKKKVTQEDIDGGLRDLKQKLMNQAKMDVEEAYRDYDQIIYSVDENSIKYDFDAQAGDEADSFDISIEADVAAVAFDREEVMNMAKEKFMSALESGLEVIEFNGRNMTYALQDYDFDDGRATVNATFEGKVSLKDYTSVIDKDELIGLNEKQLAAYLNDRSELAGFELEFFPSFLKRVPSLRDRIYIDLRK